MISAQCSALLLGGVEHLFHIAMFPLVRGLLLFGAEGCVVRVGIRSHVLVSIPVLRVE